MLLEFAGSLRDARVLIGHHWYYYAPDVHLLWKTSEKLSNARYQGWRGIKYSRTNAFRIQAHESVGENVFCVWTIHDDSTRLECNLEMFGEANRQSVPFQYTSLRCSPKALDTVSAPLSYGAQGDSQENDNKKLSFERKSWEKKWAVEPEVIEGLQLFSHCNTERKRLPDPKSRHLPNHSLSKEPQSL